jgi:hypothetical protein
MLYTTLLSYLHSTITVFIVLQVDKAASVRRQLLDLLSAAVAARPTSAVLSATAACLSALLADDQVQVARQAAIAAHGVLQAGFALHMRTPQVRCSNETAIVVGGGATWQSFLLEQPPASSWSYSYGCSSVQQRAAAVALQSQLRLRCAAVIKLQVCWRWHMADCRNNFPASI